MFEIDLSCPKIWRLNETFDGVIIHRLSQKRRGSFQILLPINPWAYPGASRTPPQIDKPTQNKFNEPSFKKISSLDSEIRHFENEHLRVAQITYLLAFEKKSIFNVGTFFMNGKGWVSWRSGVWVSTYI